jgi:hypothetical protein
VWLPLSVTVTVTGPGDATGGTVKVGPVEDPNEPTLDVCADVRVRGFPLKVACTDEPAAKSLPVTNTVCPTAALTVGALEVAPYNVIPGWTSKEAGPVAVLEELSAARTV